MQPPMSAYYNFTDLRLFLAVAEERSLTRGAARANLSLSAASLRIKNLEQTLGVRLFERGGQSIVLLPAGHTLLRHARTLMSQMSRMHDDLQEHAEGSKSVLRISLNTSAMSELLPDVLQTFLIEHPDVNIDLREQLGSDILRALHEKTCDIGIIARDQASADLHVIPYRSDRLVLVAAAHHPLATESSVCFADTLNFDFIGQPEGNVIQLTLARAAAEHGRKLMMRIQVGSYDVMCRMIEAGIGVGVMPEGTANRYAGRYALHVVQLQDDWATRELAVCVRDPAGLPEAGLALIDMLVATQAQGMVSLARRVEYS